MPRHSLLRSVTVALVLLAAVTGCTASSPSAPAHSSSPVRPVVALPPEPSRALRQLGAGLPVQL